MKLRNLILGIAGALICLAPVSLAQSNGAIERIFYNAKIFTAEPEHPYAEAVAIRGDKIIAVGNLAEVVKSASVNLSLIHI